MIKTRAIAVMILIGAILIGYFSYYSQVKPQSAVGRFPFRLGLDLAGGSHLVYQADVSQVPLAEVSDSMTALQNVISRRVNAFGVSEPLVEVQSGHKLIVELPGVTDVNQAIANIGQTPVLEFKIITAKQQEELASTTATMTAQEKASTTMAAFTQTGLTGRMLQRAELNFDQTTGAPSVTLIFNSEGTALFASTTKANIGNVIGIFLDGSAISLPVVRETITDGKAQISGTFDVKTAQELVRNLNYGALPVPISLLSTQTIGASLGQSAADGGLKAGLIAFAIIAIFLILWYRLPGVIAVVSLGVYISIMLAIFKLLPVTLTAEGVAGFILSIGMAVDANILIFERMKEESKRGLPLWQAMHEGFGRAWPSIRDSNLSSLITGLILFFLGSNSVIKGFALVFMIGVGVSMFTAITASRMFLYAIAPKNAGGITKFLFSNGFNFTKSNSDVVVANNNQNK